MNKLQLGEKVEVVSKYEYFRTLIPTMERRITKQPMEVRQANKISNALNNAILRNKKNHTKDM